MSWAVTMEGRADPAGIVLLIEDRDEAESIARELCGRGTRVVVRPYPPHPAAQVAAPLS
ncbi:MAG TPA: hypothetical protein VKI19_14505 [Acidimicrobiales bacterium]|nr:hypothetical protein [Acidimicrobiales bacterium]